MSGEHAERQGQHVNSRAVDFRQGMLLLKGPETHPWQRLFDSSQALRPCKCPKHDGTHRHTYNHTHLHKTSGFCLSKAT